jgi:hypothetical protein
MRKYIFILSSIAILLFTLSGCEVIGGIFKAGVWSGILIVVFIVFLIILLIRKANKKN